MLPILPFGFSICGPPMSQRRQRVRRLALEEHGKNLEPEANATKPAKRSRKKKVKKSPYASSALRRHQNKTTDLIPKRRIPLAVTVVLLLAGIGLLNYLATLTIDWKEAFGFSNALSLTGPGTLSGWFSSFLLILSGLASLQIYALRQHRNDDYRGSYRIWLWMAGIFLLASVNSVVNLGQLFSAIAGSFVDSASSNPQRMFWWILSAKLLALSGLVVRGLFEVRASKGALAMVALVWFAYSASIVIQIPPAKEAIVANFETVYGNCLLVGTASLFLFVVVYARFVFLSANDLLKVKKKVKKVATKRKPKAAGVKTQEQVETEDSKPLSIAEETKPKKTAAKNTAPSKAKPAATQTQPEVEQPKPSKFTSPLSSKMRSMKNESSEEEAEIINLLDKQHLSKSEKRRLKKLERRVEQRRAA